MSIEEINETYEEMCKEIHYINERLVLLLNEIECGYEFSPYNSDDKELKDLWEKIGYTRNMYIYKKEFKKD